MMVVYEIHTHRDGTWKIDSVFDDKDLAVLEATRLERSNRHPAVRVVEETVDQATDHKVTRTIYRTAKSELGAPPKTEPRKVPTSLNVNRPTEVIKSEKPISSAPRWLLICVLTVAAVIFCSLGAIYALNALAH
jgi:hypothetical protein